MTAIDKLFARFGFVRLARYGLAMAPDGRILSWRDAVLDDGGRKIVGWLDADPSHGLLPAWAPRSAPQPTPVAAVATPVASAPTHAAALEELDDDEWEWAIVVARARAAAADADLASAAPIAIVVDPSARAFAAPARIVQIPPRLPAASSVRPVVAPPPLPPVARRGRGETIPPPAKTVIPVPPLPKIAPLAAAAAPARALPTPIPPASPRRFPKGTSPIDHGAVRRHVAVITPGPIATQADAPLPPAANAVALPSILARTRTAR